MYILLLMILSTMSSFTARNKKAFAEKLLSPHHFQESTAAPNVKILAAAFAIPQLKRERRIWVYLPPAYEKSRKRYPVLYMQDGQNLFDAKTSFAGEWQVDETLNQLDSTLKQNCIVIGIDNGAEKRMTEYAPWDHPRFGKGEGAAYTRFMVETLKPYIDQHFRTLPEPSSTAVMGSSMGGLIAFYAALEYPHVFGKAGVFSPSFWHSEAAFEFAQKKAPQAKKLKIYLLTGALEGKAEMIEPMQRMTKVLQAAGFTKRRLFSSLPKDGKHNEAFWAREFAGAYTWLF
jgi:predicted alpha/beta superfamily hydrolase